MGGKSSRSGVDGVLVVDKPGGCTSHDAVQVVRRAVGQRRVGHTGTLDPDATGVLVCCLGKATRLVRFLQDSRKTYIAQVRFGVETTTQDASGEPVTERDADHLDEPTVRGALTAFEGRIEQLPPMMSAVKIGGERLHHKARRGEEVAREPREVTVDTISLDAFVPGGRPEARLAVTCSSGTYVRTLVHDVGRALGTGAHLTGLRRTVNGAFVVDEAHPLDAVERAGDEGGARDLVLPLAAAARGLPGVEIDAAAAHDVATGRTLPPAGHDRPYAVLHDGRLLAVYADRDGRGRAEVVLVTPEDLREGARS